MTKRIAVISDHASPLAALGGTDCGGQNVYVAHLALELAERGHFVDVFTRRDRADAPTIVQWAQRVRIIHVDAGPPHCIPKEQLLPHMPAFAEFMIEFAEGHAISYDILHANFWTSAVAARIVARATDTPFVITFHALGRVRRIHQGSADGFPAERGDIEEELIAEANAVIAECPQDEYDLVTYYGALVDRMRIIPCGVDVKRFHPVDKRRARAALGIVGDGPILLQLGRMVPRKGVDDVIRALAHLRREQDIEARLLVVGGETDAPDEAATPYLATLRRVAEECDVANAVTFVGRRSGDALRYYYSAADLFVTTPWYEPFGITPLEAMACGTPVVGSKVGGIQYSVVDGETGLLVPPRDPMAIASASARILRDESLHARMSASAIARVRSQFRWRDVVTSIDEFYSDSIERSQPSTTSRVLPTVIEARA